MSNNSNPYMNQNMSANMRGMNMRGGCGCANPAQGQRTVSNDCGCTGNAASTMQNSYTQRAAQNDCGCGMTPVTQRTAHNDCGCGMTPVTQRVAQNDCGCAGNNGYTRASDLPSGNRASLLAYIDQVSFAAYDAALYLDTHPDCQNGLQYFRDHNEKRNQALKEYARLYGPMNLTQAGESCEAYWHWINQPWPWEGGNC